MDQLMENLLYLLDTPKSEAQIQAEQDGKEAIRVAEQRLTRAEFDNLWSAIIDTMHSDEVKSFTLGFRLGIQLAIEGLKPISPK